MQQGRRATSRAAVLGALATVAILGLAAVLVAGGSISAPTATSSSSVIAQSAPWPTPIRHVIVLFLENAELSSVLANGTYERSLASSYALAGQSYAVIHYSLPNYEAATSGLDSNLLSVTPTSHIGDLAGQAGRTWGAFEESMPAPCTTVSSGTYDVYHNPFLAYRDVVNNPARCDKHLLNLTSFNADIITHSVPSYSLIVPNLTDDAHDNGVASADAWLANWLPPLLSQSFFESTALFITYDEGTSNLGLNGSGGGHVYTVLVSPYARMGYNSTVGYSTFSLLTSAEWLLGLGRTGHNDNWSVNSPMTDLFDFSPHYAVRGLVTDAAGVPIAGAQVAATGVPGTLTHSNGHYTLLLTDGTYTITASAPGYGPVSRTVVVSGGATFPSPLKLPPI